MTTQNGRDPATVPTLDSLALFADRPTTPAARRLAGPIPVTRHGAATAPTTRRTATTSTGTATGPGGGPAGHDTAGFVPAGSPPTPPAPNGHPNGRPDPAGESPEFGPTSGLLDLPDVDWDVVADLRTQVSEKIKNLGEGGGISLASHGKLAEPYILDEVRSLGLHDLRIGGPGQTPQQEARLCKAVRDAIFGMGRLQPALELEGVSNVEVRWHRGQPITWIEFADGRLERGPAAAGSAAEMIRDLQLLAGQAGRSFSPNTPLLNLTLENGSRLSASAWRHPAPVITIRNHLFDDVDLWDLVEKNALDHGMASFLEAASLAGKNVVFAGVPGSGKTTFARAHLNALPPEIGIGTIESEFELRLEELVKHPHLRVWAAEAREGSAELDSYGHRIGTITMSDLLRHALRANVQRIVVGEVRGPEIVAMLDAMLASSGSVSTLHATDCRGAVQRLATCATEASPNITTENAYRRIAMNIDVIVHLQYIDEGHLGGRRHRFISEIHDLSLGETEANHVAHNKIYERGPDGRATPTGLPPTWIDDLIPYGFDPDQLRKGHSTWAAPLNLERGRR